MKNPQISVVIPLYNKEQRIRNTLESVSKQTIKDFEIIVIDDGSTDNGAEVCKNFPDSRICLFQQKNQGVSVARNQGIKMAKADLIAFLDADDAWEPTFLDTILSLKRTFPEAVAYATSYYMCNRQGQKVKINLSHLPSENWQGILTDFFKFEALDNTHIFFTSSICVKKIIFQQIGGFCVGEHMGQDLDMWYRIALNYPIAYSAVPQSTYYYDYIYDNAFTKLRMKKVKKEMQHIKTLRQAINSDDISEETKYWINISLARHELIMVKLYIANNNRHKAISALARSNINFVNKFYWFVLALLPYEIFKKGFATKQYLKMAARLIH